MPAYKTGNFNWDALLPDHLHCLWTLPEGDTDFSLRWKVIKLKFARTYLRNGGTEWPVTASGQRRGERGLWQRRFWEHTVRHERELEILCNYIHYNPVKHGHARCPHAWPFSSFETYVAAKRYPADWCCGKQTCLNHLPNNRRRRTCST